MRYSYQIEKTQYPTSVALGFFDGVHIGHRAIINECKRYSDCTPTVLTFATSPSSHTGDSNPKLITTNEQKLKIFDSLDIQQVYLLDFESIKDMDAETFVREILHEKLNAKHVCCGFNYRFGKGGAGDTEVLRRECEKYSINTHIVDSVMYEDAPVSSTRIRECIESGDIKASNAMLDRPYSIEKDIISGNHIGSLIHTPTINLSLDDDLLIPKFGVYASRVTIGDKCYYGATNIGTHPTVGGRNILCETHLLSCVTDDLNSQHATVELISFLRKEEKFADIEQLKSQISKDIKKIKDFFEI